MGVNKIVPLAVYLAIILFYVYSLKSLKENDERNKRNHKDQVNKMSKEILTMGKYKNYFFTFWTFMLQIIFVSLAIVDELTKLLGLPNALQKLLGKSRAFIFNSILFPCTLLVITTFWSLWHIDRELIFPKALDQFFPSWLNHVLHTFIGIPLLVELLLPKKDHSVGLKVAAIAMLAYCAVYQALYFSIYFSDGVWLYPVYKALDWPQRAIFNVFQVALLLTFQFVGLKIQNGKIPSKKSKKVK